MKVLVLLICLCLSVANAKPFTQHFVTTPFVFGYPNQVAPQAIPTFRTTGTPVATFPFVFNRFHTQDPNGAYTFSYSGGPSSRTETRDQFGNVVGAFNYVDPEGKIQTQQYVADSQGFRVAGTNLPVEPFITVKETKTHRTKREATPFGKTPASTVPIKPVDVQVVPQTYSSGVAPQFVPGVTPHFFTGVTPQIVPGVTNHIVPNIYTINRNVIPNFYTGSQTPVTTYPYNVYPTFYTVPTVVPKTETTKTTDVKSDFTSFQPITYSGVQTQNPFFTNYFTRHVNTQKTPNTNTGFTFYY